MMNNILLIVILYISILSQVYSDSICSEVYIYKTIDMNCSELGWRPYGFNDFCKVCLDENKEEKK